MNKILLSLALLPMLALNAQAQIEQSASQLEIETENNSACSNCPQKSKVRVSGEAIVSASSTYMPRGSQQENNVEKRFVRMQAKAEGKLNVLYKDTTQNGLDYGAKIVAKVFGVEDEAEANYSDIKLNKFYVFAGSGQSGLLKIGRASGPEKKLCGGQSLLGGDEGFESEYFSNRFDSFNPFGLDGSAEKKIKISYLTPSVAGIQLIGAVTPKGTDFAKSNDSDEAVGRKLETETNYSLGLLFTHDFNEDTTVQLAGVGIYACAPSVEAGTESLKKNDLFAYQLTAKVSYKNFAIAGGYLDNRKSYKEYKNVPDQDAGYVWNIGAKYSYKKIDLAAVYHQLKKKEAVDTDLYSGTIDYAVLPNAKIFLGYNIKILNKDEEGQELTKKTWDHVVTCGAKVEF